MPYFYLARCADNSLYAGSCKNVSARETKHNKGEGAKYTQQRRPIKIIYFEKFKTSSEAMRREIQVKKWRREKKENLVKYSHPFEK
ncbi:GIY-YIG nuclease family protein [Candidatus Peregrinibacteria bacterium]|nr:GIY-YIG nuclease family protein [Candidatus Peregrinibacteria bacterium]